MNIKAYFVVQPYERDEQGRLIARQPIQAKDADQARRLARTLNCAGAVAFSRACDPEMGEYEDAVILLSVGQVPPTDEGIAA